MKYFITLIALTILMIDATMVKAGPLQETITCPSEVRGRLDTVKDFTPPSGWEKGDLNYGGYIIVMPVVRHWIANNKMVCGYGVRDANHPQTQYPILRITKTIGHGWHCSKAPNFSFQCNAFKPQPPKIPRKK
ncbi:hypothetical protein [Desulfacinum hydrothermale]|uniref:hypothetical protein n=1 Tax=Desulfacinum hydrothermale TaxID=109258 RepID=UPI00111BE228|nr:hypothetical protein [Desulfacinum hydrothermale]